MRWFFLVFLSFWAPTVAASEKLAVLEFQGPPSDLLSLLSDDVRAGALKATKGRDILVMTRENMLDLMDSNSDESKCLDDTCEVTIGRSLGADYVITGKLGQVEGVYILSLRLHETSQGKLVATEKVLDASGVALSESAQRAGRLLGGRIGSPASLPSGGGRLGSVDLASGGMGDIIELLESRRQLEKDYIQRMEKEKQEVIAPLQRQASEEWLKVKAFASKRDEFGKKALEAYIQSYFDMHVELEGRTYLVLVPEVDDAAKMLFGYVIEWKGAASYPMIRVNAGEFEMGSSSGDVDERPVHKVKLTRDFYMGKNEVSQGLYRSVMGKNPSGFAKCGSTCPVENVSWCDAVLFSNRLSGVEGLEPVYYLPQGFGRGMDSKTCSQLSLQVRMNIDSTGYRLPTEAEWEYAAKGGKSQAFPGSVSVDAVSWYKGNSYGRSHPVQRKGSNGYELHDMSGNVWEWVWDWYNGAYNPTYSSVTAVDPLSTKPSSSRVQRGGGWKHEPSRLRIANRGSAPPGERSDDLGLRLARTAP
jgi:formylglycine-generating enzyme required for sulfatase activity